MTTLKICRELISTECLYRNLTIDTSESIWDLLPPVPKPKLENLLDRAAGARQESLMEHVICKKRQATEKEGDEDEDEDEDDEESHTK
ncbi:hypothetical protein BGZ74_009687 [Mortierella antarctica]|nr:hypothetical protein BGZ74_009687 [Mortierella antarctica]